MTETVRPSPADLRRASSEVFTGLDVGTIDALAGAMQRVELPAETVLVRQGEPADALFVVLEGRLASAVESADSPSPQALGTMGPGDVIGEVAVLTGTRRTATVRTETASTVAALSANDLWRLAAAHPELIDRLLATSTRTSHTSRRSRRSGPGGRVSGTRIVPAPSPIGIRLVIWTVRPSSPDRGTEPFRPPAGGIDSGLVRRPTGRPDRGAISPTMIRIGDGRDARIDDNEPGSAARGAGDRGWGI